MTVQCNMHRNRNSIQCRLDDRNYCVWRFNKIIIIKWNKEVCTATDIHMSVKIDIRLGIHMKPKCPWEKPTLDSFWGSKQPNQWMSLWISSYCHLWSLNRVNYVGGNQFTEPKMIFLLIEYLQSIFFSVLISSHNIRHEVSALILRIKVLNVI